MIEIIMFAGLFAFVMVVGFIAGYAFRGLMHKDIAAAHEKYQQLHNAAVADFREIIAAVRSKV